MAFYGDQHFTQHGFPSCTCGQYPPVGSTMDTVKSFKAKLKAYMPELFGPSLGLHTHSCILAYPLPLKIYSRHIPVVT